MNIIACAILKDEFYALKFGRAMVVVAGVLIGSGRQGKKGAREGI